MTELDNEGFVRSFARGLSVLETMGTSGPHTLASIATATGLPRTVVRRISLTLCELGYAVLDEDKVFHLTTKVLSLGTSYLTSLPFWGHAQRVLESLCAQLQESCAIALFDGSDAVFVLRIPSSKIMSLRLGMGSRLPAYATAPGRLLLAHCHTEVRERYLQTHALAPLTQHTLTEKDAIAQSLAQIQRDGYAWVDGEFDPHVTGLAVPIYDEKNQVSAAISANLLRLEFDLKRAQADVLPALRNASMLLAGLAPAFLHSRSAPRL
ncbi:helix-turn-helix domain-containing protein [Diaphorobacter sp. HDW4A]|uniref:IclR family transcriptional regulator domain-containing protein n=1 Tax=Diaphorobacter sp. HDW4A TaxID=2714924 RepID=UPI001409ED1D|nr:IclR family transcriptional regulator C-terminal domain-containing protein [Diaphorobacter sp. HDW4A]QIL81580.1 helix-turn-helix domain-containing protein [Diaphorobacter sp. HDW4A]